MRSDYMHPIIAVQENNDRLSKYRVAHRQALQHTLVNLASEYESDRLGEGETTEELGVGEGSIVL